MHEVVREGDTLYGIAWRYDLDYRSLAAWNEIEAPYLIRSGLRLALTPPRAPDPKGGEQIRAGSQVSTAPATPPPTSTAPIPAADPPRPAERSPEPRSKPAAAKQPIAERIPTADQGGTIRWQWPASGDIIGRFGSGARGGIDLGGELGQPILAAAAGEVVYSGVGLVGYGELIIIKHNEEYLSAYAHNRRRMVSEGERVSKGHRIAEMGDSGTDRPKLHFEIRKGGKPVDPLRYLPAK